MPLNQQVRESASCQNEVVLPWSKDTLKDAKFPATGPVYTELPKPFPGLAGESRSGDANGQWFRVLAAGGTNLVQFAPGVFGTTALPLLGVNPPKPKTRPPLRNDVPCETQETPDLESRAADPPKQRRIDVNNDGLQGALGQGPPVRPRSDEAVAQARGPRQEVQGLRQGHHQGRDRAAHEGEDAVTAIKKNLGNFAAILGLIVIAAGVSFYILNEQRMRFPFIEPKPFELKAEFSTAQAVVAGQGQTVRVSGVRIGDIGGVELKDGHAVIKMDIDREYDDLVHTNASALLRPKTGLKDMFIDLEPGGDDAPVAKQGFTIPIRATQPDVNPDEVLGVLDTDTREYLQLLVNGLGRGLEGRGGDLRDLFARFEPTHRDLARVNGAVATRRKQLRHLVTSLNVLSKELASHDDDLASLVDSSAAVFDSFAQEQSNVSSAVHELPSTLKQTTDTLGRVDTFAELLGPTTQKLRPAARALAPANEAVRPFAKEATPQLRKSIRPFVRESRPLVRDLRPVSERLAKAAPGPDAGGPALQPLPEPARLQPERPRGRRRRRPPGGLPVLAGVDEPRRHAAVLDLGRARHVPPGHDRGAVRDARPGAAGGARARVHLGADAAADRLRGLQRRRQRRRAAPPRAPRPRPRRRRRRADADLRPLLLARDGHGGLRALVLRAAAVPVAVVRRADPAQAEGLPRAGRLPGGDPARARGRRPRGRRLGRQAAQEEARPAGQPHARRARDRPQVRAR